MVCPQRNRRTKSDTCRRSFEFLKHIADVCSCITQKHFLGCLSTARRIKCKVHQSRETSLPLTIRLRRKRTAKRNPRYLGYISVGPDGPDYPRLTVITRNGPLPTSCILILNKSVDSGILQFSRRNFLRSPFRAGLGGTKLYRRLSRRR